MERAGTVACVAALSWELIVGMEISGCEDAAAVEASGTVLMKVIPFLVEDVDAARLVVLGATGAMIVVEVLGATTDEVLEITELTEKVVLVLLVRPLITLSVLDTISELDVAELVVDVLDIAELEVGKTELEETELEETELEDSESLSVIGSFTTMSPFCNSINSLSASACLPIIFPPSDSIEVQRPDLSLYVYLFPEE